jgi:uncharacterized protein (TIGR03067 family)
MRWFFAPLLAALLISPARSQDPPNLKSDEHRVQGSWVVESWHDDGKSIPADELKMRTVFFGGPVYMLRRDGKPFQAGTFKFDSTKTPKTFTAVVKDVENKDGILLGVYELSGDTLTLCFDPEGQSRPATLKPGPKSGFSVVVLRKPKPPADEQVEIAGRYRSESFEFNGQSVTSEVYIERRGDSYLMSYRKDGKLVYIGTAIRRGDKLAMCWASAGQVGVSLYLIEKGPKLSGEGAPLGGPGLTGREVLTPWKEID